LQIDVQIAKKYQFARDVQKAKQTKEKQSNSEII
jgi:hypothetical protein